jgi:putative spermidine/putrescine transport system permease protein
VFDFVCNRFAGKSALNLLIMVPIIVPAIASALGYFGFSSLIHLIGTRAGMIVAHSVLPMAVSFVVIVAALKGFDHNIERAAMSTGAGPLRTFLALVIYSQA